MEVLLTVTEDRDLFVSADTQVGDRDELPDGTPSTVVGAPEQNRRGVALE